MSLIIRLDWPDSKLMPNKRLGKSWKSTYATWALNEYRKMPGCPCPDILADVKAAWMGCKAQAGKHSGATGDCSMIELGVCIWESQDDGGTGGAHQPTTKPSNSDCDPACAEQVQTPKLESEAYRWAREFEAAFIAGNFAEAARLAGERNLLIPAVKHEVSKP